MLIIKVRMFNHKNTGVPMKMTRTLMLLALVSGLNTAPTMASEVAAPQPTTGRLKRVGKSIASTASKGWNGFRRFMGEQVFNKKKLGRNAKIAGLVALLTALATAGQARYDRGLNSVELGEKGRWRRFAGRLRGGDDTHRGRLFGYRAGSRADDGAIVGKVMDGGIDFDELVARYGSTVVRDSHPDGSLLTTLKPEFESRMRERGVAILREEAARLGVHLSQERAAEIIDNRIGLDGGLIPGNAARREHLVRNSAGLQDDIAAAAAGKIRAV